MSLQLVDAIKKFYPVPDQDMIEESDIKCVKPQYFEVEDDSSTKHKEI